MRVGFHTDVYCLKFFAVDTDLYQSQQNFPN